MLQSYKGFIITLKALAIFTSVMFYGPVFVLFYEKVGLSFADITKLKVIIFITITLLEVPLGSYSDIYGIKKTIKMGIMFFILSFFITAFSNHFFVFAVSSIIFGIASALISGCTQILLFDFLKQQGKSDSFTKENGSLVFYQQVSSALSLLAGSFVFGIDYRAPYIVTAVFFFVGYAFVSEIDFDCNQYSGPVRGGRKVYVETLKKSFELLKDRNIFFVLFLSSIFNAATMATFDMIQVALKKV